MIETDERILVTGGAGFIGSHLAGEFHDAGAAVQVVDNCANGTESLVPDGVGFERVDIRNDDLEPAVRRFEPTAIVHLAARHYIPYCNAHPEEAFEVNVMGTRNLLDVGRELPTLDTLLFTSSAAVYPPAVGPHAESDDPGPTDIYGRSKLVGEDLSRLFHEDTGVSTVVARLFNTYGPNETNEHLIPAILAQVNRGDRELSLGNLEPARDFIHVVDVVRAITTVVTEFEGGFETFNVGTGTEHSVREVVETTSEALGEDLEITQDEARTRESDRPHLRADITRLRTQFGWEPTVDLVTGLRDLIGSDRVLVE